MTLAAAETVMATWWAAAAVTVSYFSPHCLDGDAACLWDIGVGNHACLGCIPLGGTGGDPFIGVN